MVKKSLSRTVLEIPEKVKQELAQPLVLPRTLTAAGCGAALTYAKRVARAWRGTCISALYVGAHTPLEFTCHAGHRFKKPLHKLRNGGWCAQCFHEARRHGLKKIQQYSASRGGVCLSSSYSNTLEKLDFRCGEGHLFRRPFREIERGEWCPACRRVAALSTPKKKAAYASYAPATVLEVLQETPDLTGLRVTAAVMDRKILAYAKRIARAWNGRCLLQMPDTDGIRRMQCRCAHGHTFSVKYNELRVGTWCSQCADDNQRLGIAAMQAIARQHGGVCLSRMYRNNLTKLQWRCEDGHVWSARPRSAKDCWCPECARLHVQRHKATKRAPKMSMALHFSR
ncbi:hypothetical protein [Collimonas antrihumi]|uniref:hypothetical protein n=1 Tax=Collimonas antrihumi TaxID=1940615 RepID=UPI001B8D4D26|nr:hypothetical protein [Collimonas antrihumi]